jgi:CRP/FNR family transcriptional regulator, cyclic AMP receptor protein
MVLPHPPLTPTAFAGKPVPEVAEDILARCAVFRRCTAGDLQALAAASRFVDLAPGEDLVREGDAADTMLVIVTGEAEVRKRGETGADHPVNALRAGDVIGEMALFDRVPRSATVRAVGPVRALVLPLAGIVALAESRATMVPVLVDMGALVSERLRLSTSTAVAATERTLAEERTRAVMGRFTLLLMLAYTIYTWVLGTAVQLKAALGRSEFITVPAIVVCVLIMAVFVRVSGYPARFFGLTLRNAGRDAAEAVLLTLPLMVGAVVLKLALVAWVPSMHGAHVFQMLAPPVPGMPETGFNPWLALAYVVFAPFQELIYRGGVQGSLSHFLSGRWRFWLANAGSNIIFSAAHLYVSPGLAVTAFLVGLFWGWLYARQGGLVGVSLSHVLLGFWAFEVVDLGVLE